MLTFLSVTDFATIEHLDLELSSGFTVLTGETGAGKSIIVDALSFLLGGRADTNVVRSGASQTKIEGIFRLNDQARMAILPLLREHGLDRDADEDLIIGREINREGPNVCRINGGLVSLRFLSAIGERIVDLHGQGEHLSLLRVPEHVRLLDNYAGSAALRQEVSDGVSRLAAVRQELTSLRGTERDSSSRADLLRFQIAEIRTAQLRAGEDEELRRELALLSNRERVQSLVEETLGVLRDGSRGLPSAIDLVGTAIGNLSYLEEYDPSWGPRREELANAVESLAELVRTLDGYRDDGEDSDRRLGEVGDRLDLIAGLKRKYGSSMDHVVAFAERAESELDAIVHDEQRQLGLEREEQEVRESVGRLSGQLSLERQSAAILFATAIESELQSLALGGTKVLIDIRQLRDDTNGVPISVRDADPAARFAVTATGIDRVEFMIAVNPGEPFRPLARVASGGETSRLMLAIKSVLSAVDEIPTLVFDEIDAGIGGRLGGTIGQKLWGLGRQHQVVSVTHLPQIASHADHHVRVSKGAVADRASTSAEVLDATEAVREISLMLGSDTDTGRHNAAEMLNGARRWQSSAARP